MIFIGQARLSAFAANARTGSMRLAAGAQDAAEGRVLLFLVRDRRVDVEGEALQQHLDGVGRSHLGQRLDGLLPVVVLRALLDRGRPTWPLACSSRALCVASARP